MKINYHTHTARCHHAAGADRDYVEAAIAGGFDMLGFSDHSPWLYNTDFVSTIRMTADDLPGYLASVASLREEYAGRLPILTGLECEYFPRYRDWMCRMREMGVSYFILGHHYISSDEDHPYVGFSCQTDDGVMEYADAVAEALATGMFVYLAHPDLFMRHRTLDQYTPACEKAARVICQAALEYGIPLEYNLLGYDLHRHGLDRGYPCPLFWEQVKPFGNRVILGVDAHDPASLADTTLWDEGLASVKALGLPIVEKLDIAL